MWRNMQNEDANFHAVERELGTLLSSGRNAHLSSGVSCVHRKKPKGLPMDNRTAIANGAKSRVRAFVEHVFAGQKSRMGLVVRTIGIARTTLKIGMANIVYNIKRLNFLQKAAAA